MQVQHKSSAVYIVNPVTKISLSQEETSELYSITDEFLNKYLSAGYHPKEKKAFIPVITNKVFQIMYKWFAALEGKTSFKSQVKPMTFRKEEAKYLHSVVTRIFQLSSSSCFFGAFSSNKISKILGDDINTRKNSEKCYYDIILEWSPGNKFLYSDTVSKIPAPLSLSRAHESHVLTEYNYYKGQTNQDFILIVEGQEIPVHKNRLAIHSEYFAKLFENGFKEAKTGKATIPKYRFVVVDKMIQFIYTGHLLYQFAYSIVDLMELTELAHMYQVKSLVNVCEAELSVHAKDHFEKAFEIAVRLDLESLIKYCLQFGECKKEYSSIIPKYVTRDNFAKLYTIAYESQFTGIQRELDNCRKYNPLLKDIKI